MKWLARVVLLGIGFGSTNAVFGGTVAGSTGVSNNEQGVAGALVNAARQIGAAIGVAVSAPPTPAAKAPSDG